MKASSKKATRFLIIFIIPIALVLTFLVVYYAKLSITSYKRKCRLIGAYEYVQNANWLSVDSAEQVKGLIVTFYKNGTYRTNRQSWMLDKEGTFTTGNGRTHNYIHCTTVNGVRDSRVVSGEFDRETEPHEKDTLSISSFGRENPHWSRTHYQNFPYKFVRISAEMARD